MKFFSARLLIVAALLTLLPGLRGQTTPFVTVLYSFTGKTADEKNPVGNLVLGSDGNFYSTAYGGGNSGFGTVFKITPAGVLVTLHRFTGQDTDGAYPFAGLVQGSDGNFYGTTSEDGFVNEAGTYGTGTIFKITPAGVLTTLHSFVAIENQQTNTDGIDPHAGLTQGSDGNFYGVARFGGEYTYGTVFRITPQGVFTTLHSFKSTDGAYPLASLLQGSDGNFYGTAGGESGGGYGTIFRITPTGVLTTLHNFGAVDDHAKNQDGAGSSTSLIQGSDGSFYGTAAYGGSGGGGTVFRVTPQGEYTVLHSFGALDANGNNADGAFSFASLVQSSDGNFYGTAYGGGEHGYGTVFRITPQGAFTTLHSFVPASEEGISPSAGLVQGSDGNLYGTTEAGGSSDAGTVFKLTIVASGDVQFSAPSVDVAEYAGSVTLTVTRNGGTGAATVGYSTADGLAAAGTDYSAVSGTLAWANGDTAARTITVPILDRNLYDGNARTFSVTLADADGADLGSPATVAVNILDAAPQPGVSLPGLSNGATVSAGSALTLSANITDPANVLAYVQLLIDGTVVASVPAGSPYVFTTTAPSTPGVHSIQAVATDTLGRTSTSSTATLDVVALPTVTVATAGDGVLVEGSGVKAKLLVVRTGDTTLPLTVAYKVKGTAVAGADYVYLPGTVTIPAGASKKKVKIKPLDYKVAGTRKIKVKLLPAPDRSYQVGAPSIARIKVIDNG